MTPSEFEKKDNMCDWALERIDALLDGELSMEETSRMQVHLEKCSACSGELELADMTRAAIRNLPTRQCPDSVTAAAMERIANDPGGERPRLWWWTALLQWKQLRPAAVGALLVLVVALSVFIEQKQEAPTPAFVKGNDTLKFSSADVALAEAEVKWTLAYINQIGRRTGLTVRDEAIYPYVVVPVRKAVTSAGEGN